VAGKISSIDESNDRIGIRTRELPACSIVPQPTKLPRAPNCTRLNSSAITVTICSMQPAYMYGSRVSTAGGPVLANEGARIGGGSISADKSTLSNLRGSDRLKTTPMRTG
jgi:hypothetical protein